MHYCALLLMTALLLLQGCNKQEEAPSRAPAKTQPEELAPKPTTESAEPPHEEPAKAAAANDRIVGEGFSAPIPKGYAPASEERITQLGQQFGQEVVALLTRGGDGLRESIFITRIDAQEIDPTSISPCRKAAGELHRVTGSPISLPASIVDYPFGKTCEFGVGAKDLTIQSYAYLGDALWTLTCKTSAKRRKEGASECRELLRGFAK